MTGKVYVGRRRPMTVQDWLRLGWGQDDAERHAVQTQQTRTEVLVVTADGVYPLAHHVRHSPDGFEWGYAGSGPAELARCILIDHYGGLDALLAEQRAERPDDIVLPVSYQQFKFAYIAKCSREEPWSITSDDINRFAAHAAGREAS